MPPIDEISVLLVDDDIVDRKNITRMLDTDNPTHYVITAATSFPEALSILKKSRFDICLVDYYLGGYTGLELLEKIHYINPHSSVIMLTGSDSEEIDNLSLEAGASSFLNKNSLTSTLLERSIRYAIYHKKLSIEHEHLAYYDPLTKLANRILFFDRLTYLIEQPHHHTQIHALLYIDLDYFQQLNESYTHAVGDAVLQYLSALLLQSVRAVDTVARLGGDEFALILEATTADDAHTIAQEIIKKLESPFLIQDLSLSVSVSIGMTFFPDSDLQKPQLILEQADQALSYAKKLGRKRYCHFDNKLKQLTEENSLFEEDLRLALKGNKIFPHYQPQYCLKTNEVEAFEALARWQRTELDLVYPQHFITQIEELKLMPELTEVIIKRACSELVEWLKTHPDLRTTINISTSGRVNSYLLNVIKRALHESEIQPQQLELEFDAVALIANPELTRVTLNELDSLGVNITINNFGKGDISLWSLAELPISTLKIDMSLIHGIGVSLSKEIIVKVILDMAKQFSLKTVAVGVETEEQAAFLLRYGCDNVQGYLYSRALNYEDCCALLAKHSQ